MWMAFPWGKECITLHKVGWSQSHLQMGQYKSYLRSRLPGSTLRKNRVSRDKKLEVVFHGDSESKESACNVDTQIYFLGWEDPLEKRMATHSSILAWRIPWTEESGGLQCMGSEELDTTEWLTFTFTRFLGTERE